MRRRCAVVPLAIALVVGGCSSEPAPPSAPPPPSTPAQSDRYQPVEFAARDGETRSGRLFGDGPVGVVLSHMGRSQDGQDDWAAFASELADRGVRVLTYEGRDRLESSWQDVLGAADHLVAAGAERIVLGGASIGAMASMHAATQAPPQVSGVIWLAGVREENGYAFQPAGVAGLGCPVLFIAGEGDAYGAARDTRELHGWTTTSNELLIVDSIRHGTDILADGGPPATQVRDAMTAFVQRVAGSGTPCTTGQT
jgi:pimeloyl-ACP methyl ester carboxylesterase